MSYTPPTQEEVLASIIRGLNTWIPELDTSKGSPEWHFCNETAGIVVGSIGNSKALHRDINPLYAISTKLVTLASLWGIEPKPATGAQDGVLGVYVANSGSWLSSLQMRSSDGLTFKADSAGSWSSSGTVDIPISAVDTGAATTKVEQSVLTILSPPSGMDDAGWIKTAFTTAGRDEEQTEELRNRLKLLFAGVGTSGNEGDFVKWMGEVTDVSQGFTFREIRFSLAVEGVIFGQASAPGSRWLSATVESAVQDYVSGTSSTAGKKAIGQNFDAVLPTAQNQNIDVEIDTDAEYGRDWGNASTDTFPSGSITGLNATQDGIEVTADPSVSPYFMAVGNRLALNVRVASSSSHNHLEVRTITNIENKGGGNYTIWVDAPFSSATITGDLYPAGPSTAGTVTAIEAAFDALGPADDADATRWPKVTSDYPCDLNLAELNRRIMDVQVDGQRRHLNTTWNAPTSDVAATASALSGSVLQANTIRLTTTRVRYTKRNSSS